MTLTGLPNQVVSVLNRRHITEHTAPLALRCLDASFSLRQIIWKMMSQTLRFSVFLVIFMASFALSFHALFHNCDDDSQLGESFGNFHQALVVVFGAPLGDFSFQELFDEGVTYSRRMDKE